jgi:hypothetical protein
MTTKRHGVAGRKLRPATQLKRIKELICRVDAGGTVSPRDLQTVLTECQLGEFETAWAGQKAERFIACEAASQLASYTKMLNSADLVDGHADQLSNRSPAKALLLRQNAEREYELALEHLQEILGQNPRLQGYLDRHADFGFGGVGLDKEQVPRPLHHAKAFNRIEHQPVVRKTDLKRQALEGAREALENGTSAHDAGGRGGQEIDVEVLRQRLKKIREAL